MPFGRCRLRRGISKARISAPRLGTRAGHRRHVSDRAFKVSRASGGQQVGRAGGSSPPATPPAHVRGEPRPGGAATCTPRGARPHSRPAPGGPGAVPRRAAPPASPRRVSRERPRPLGAPGRALQLRPVGAPAPHRAPRALTQRQEGQQQRPRRQAPHARRAGATLPRLRARRRSSPSSSGSGGSRASAPLPGPRACSALLASREIPTRGLRAPGLRARLLPALLQPAGHRDPGTGATRPA